MLEAIRERAQGWIAKVILALLIIPFALWGVDSYFSGSGKEAPAATVGDAEISQREFIKTLKDQQEALGGKVEEKALRQLVMDQMINTRVLSMAAEKSGFAILDPQIQAVLMGVEIFQENGKFSPTRLESWLRGRGMSQGELLAMISQDLLLKQLQIGYGEGALVAQPGVSRLAQLLGQKREVNEAIFSAAAYAKGVRIDDTAIQAEYAAHQKDYATPAQARLQYAVLSQSNLESAVQISEDQIRAHFEANMARYQEPEQRRASHILIKLDVGADAATRQTAKSKAEQVLAEVQKSPGKFADLARQYSQDTGSGANGGDLGAFTRDMMVKPFADAVWAMKPGEIRGLVESQFGYHIIRLDSVLPGAKMGYEVVKPEIMQELKQQEAQRRFVESAERFSNMVYEQPDSLEPVAKEFGIKLEESGWISQAQAQPAVLANPRLLESVFSEENLSKRQNIEAVEVAPNTLVSARVIEHRPAGVRPLAEVADSIRNKLTAQAALKLAVEAGKKALAEAVAGKMPAGFSAPMTLSRMQPLNLPPAAIKAVFRADAGKLPAFVGVETADAYRLYRIGRLIAEEPAANMVQTIRNDMRKLLAQEEMRAYLEYLKVGTKIKIAPTTLEPKAD